MTQKLGASPSTTLVGFDVVDWTTLVVVWTTLGVGLTADAAGIEVEIPVLHKSLWQHSNAHFKTTPDLLNDLQAVR